MTGPCLHRPIGHCPRTRPSRLAYGYAVHPLSTVNHGAATLSSRTHISTWMDTSGDEHLVHRDVASLEVGDNVYVSQMFTPRCKVLRVSTRI